MLSPSRHHSGFEKNPGHTITEICDRICNIVKYNQNENTLLIRTQSLLVKLKTILTTISQKHPYSYGDNYINLLNIPTNQFGKSLADMCCEFPELSQTLDEIQYIIPMDWQKRMYNELMANSLFEYYGALHPNYRDGQPMYYIAGDVRRFQSQADKVKTLKDLEGFGHLGIGIWQLISQYDFSEILDHSKNIQAFSFGSLSSWDGCEGKLLELSKILDQIRYLGSAGDLFESVPLDLISHICALTPQIIGMGLEHINFSHFSTERKALVYKKISNLKYLSLSSCNLTRFDIEDRKLFFSHLTSLISLKLSHNPLETQNEEELRSITEPLQSLRTLTLNYCHLDRMKDDQLLALFSPLKSLQTLIISGDTLSPTHLKNTIPSLQEVSLTV